MRYLLVLLLVASGVVGCATAQPSDPKPCCPIHGKKTGDGIAIMGSPRPCICPKGFDCGDCCGPNHCVCNPN